MNSKTCKRLFLFTVLVVLFIGSTAWGANLEVHIINVGQGDCELIVSPTGKTVLIDAGNTGKGNSAVFPYLDNLGITDLDYTIASHYDADHIGGLDEVVTNLGGSSHILSAAYDRGGAKIDNTIAFQDYVTAVGQKRTTIVPGQVINLGGGATLTCIAVDGRTQSGTIYPGSDENNLSIVLRLDYCDFQMYFGGDSGQTIEAATASLAGDMDVYKVSHHGSNTASSQSFLDVIKPEVSTISVGENNQWHPDIEVIDRLVNIASYIYQTETGQETPPAGHGEVANSSFKIRTDGCSYTVSGSGIFTAAYQTDGSNDGCCGGSGTGIVFSEVLYDSWVYYDTEGEWLELYNSTSTAVDIGGWTISDNSKTYTIPSGTTIGSHSYIVIADGQSEFSQRYGCDPHLSNLTLRLNNDGDFLTLKNSSGSVVDQVAWESYGSYISGWGSTSQPYADEGKSIVRSDVNQDTDTYADWLSNQNADPNLDGTPEIALSLTNIQFEVWAGAASDSQTFSVSNTGCETLNWSVTDDAGWLNCTPGSGTDSGVVSVAVNSSGLAVGTYAGTVTVSDPAASNSPQTVNVTLTVSDCPAPKIVLSSTELSFEACPGSVANSQTFSVSNSGCETLYWSVTDDAGWLACSPSSGTNSGEVTVSVNSSGLTTGSYTGTITVSDPNAFNSPQTVNVTLTVLDCEPPQIALNRTELYYGASGGMVTSGQIFLIGNSGGGTLNWSVTDNTSWLSCTPSSGIGSGAVTVSVNHAGLSVGTYTGFVTVSDPNASNSPQILAVTLKVYNSGSTSIPFGDFATPVHGSNVSSSIPVTGWVLDDIEVVSVKIYNGSSYVGDAVFVEGARPDLEQAFPGYPKNYQAGWGYMMLSHFLPNGGNGTYTLYAKATDAEGNQVTLGSKTINIDNANAVKPFGALDTPTQGGNASGSGFINWGWVLTPQPNSIPSNGSTINVYVDGVKLGNPTYNIYRSDIANLFPGYANSYGAIGYFYLDTTPYDNGVHSIYWTAKDTGGNSDGIGSRYFNVQNTGGNRTHSVKPIKHKPGSFSEIPVDYSEPVTFKKGYREDNPMQTIYPDDNGNIIIEIKELQRIEVKLDADGLMLNTGKYTGYLQVGGQLRSLPIGTTFDAKRGIFYWQPGPGFIGDYEFVFIKEESARLLKRNITIRIRPRF